MFNRFDGTRLYITQPYLTIEYINTDESFQKFLEDNELISKVSELDSWYMPGSTILIQFEIRNELEYIKKMKMQRKNIRPFL